MAGLRDMYWVLVGTYVTVHLALYVLVFRNVKYFSTERGIFLFHLVPALVLTALMTALFVSRPTYDNFALVVGAAAAHGIYSLSFLECWVLSEGGYSLRVLTEIVRRQSAPAADVEQHFMELSARKKKGRMQSLFNLGLVRPEGERYELTPKGRMTANIIARVARLADFRVPS